MILVKGREDVFRKRPILGQTASMQNQKSFDDEVNMNNKTFAEELRALHLSMIKDHHEKNVAEKKAKEEADEINSDGASGYDPFRKRPILGNRILTPVRDKPVKVKEPVQNVPLPKVEPTPPKPEAPQESSPMDAAMEEIRRAAEERERFAQMMGGAFSDGTNMITGLSSEARDMIGLLMAQGIPANQAQDIARQRLGE